MPQPCPPEPVRRALAYEIWPLVSHSRHRSTKPFKYAQTQWSGWAQCRNSIRANPDLLYIMFECVMNVRHHIQLRLRKNHASMRGTCSTETVQAPKIAGPLAPALSISHSRRRICQASNRFQASGQGSPKTGKIVRSLSRPSRRIGAFLRHQHGIGQYHHGQGSEFRRTKPTKRHNGWINLRLSGIG